ncbi:MAG TPA: sugar phosphate nucleotidyltransferase [Chitinivibrionales bacterium]|jgi:mannose-1-phosphate guanylyltransferase|nr:sugar phosphate nucleotidyltransferase [Chitinivibrionales bacterium]
MKTIPLILAGGKGERFWPLSRSWRPKQLLSLSGPKTMIEETVKRVRAASGNETPLIITGRDCERGIRKALSGRGAYRCIVEPVGRNTAPAIALAAAWMQQRYGEAVMLVASADHAITPLDKYVHAVRAAVAVAKASDSLVVFGVAPTRPETGYGYIEIGRRVPAAGARARHCFFVKRFVEKPTLARARAYAASKNFLWNSGMFVWKTSVILAEFRRSMPALYEQAQRAGRRGFTKRAITSFYRSCESQSIDYGIMEHARRIVAVRGAFFWDDIGSWEAMARIHRPNSRGTVAVGKGIFESDCENTIVHNTSGHAVAALGLKDTVLVATPDAVLAISRQLLPQIKKYLGMMKERGFSKKLF